MNHKQELRLAIKERLGRLSAREREVESAIVRRELKKFLGASSRCIGAYIPFLDEPDIRILLEEWLGERKDVSIPFVNSNHSMAFWTVKSLADIERDPVTKIFQPMNGLRIDDESAIDAVIVPGRAFTSDGARIGRGNGGYDRWLREQRKRNPKTLIVGTCFDCQILTDIPMDPHDERVDHVISATKIFHRAIP
jgi:5-formyltetrahydrofolate cyclo-ligase